ncbi:hypothetical protein IFM47457_02132 [Aspergillus lentulus]|nr:hypothetical protein IFM47457_02132 [Aspergillus lentulus]
MGNWDMCMRGKAKLRSLVSPSRSLMPLLKRPRRAGLSTMIRAGKSQRVRAGPAVKEVAR